MCDCMTTMDEQLKGQPSAANTMLVFNLMGPARAVVATCKRREKDRQKPVYVMASYCPFCGERYAASTKSELAA